LIDPRRQFTAICHVLVVFDRQRGRDPLEAFPYPRERKSPDASWRGYPSERLPQIWDELLIAAQNFVRTPGGSILGGNQQSGVSDLNSLFNRLYTV